MDRKQREDAINEVRKQIKNSQLTDLPNQAIHAKISYNVTPTFLTSPCFHSQVHVEKSRRNGKLVIADLLTV